MRSLFALRSPLQRSLFTTAVAATLFAPSACNKDEEAAEAGAEAAASTDGADGAAAQGNTETAAARPVVKANRLGEHGGVLGHVLMPNGEEFVGEVKNQLAAGQSAGFVDVGFLRGMLAGQLRDRSGLAQNVVLSKPIGCAVLSPKAFEVPAACHMSYKGGLEQMVKDLGDEGKQADAAGHAAHYVIEGQALYVDTLGDDVVVSGHAEVFGKAKSYLESNLISRAHKVASDVEIVVYAGAILELYKDELTPLLELVSEPQSLESLGDPKLDKLLKQWNTYNTKSTKDAITRFSEMEQLTVGLGLEELGFVARFALFPTDGSRMQSEAKANAGPALNHSLVAMLPASSWFVIGGSINRDTYMSTQTMTELKALVSESYAELTGKNADKVRAKWDAFIDEANRQFTNETAIAFAHEPGTMGGMVVVSPLKAGQSSREGWKAFTKEFTSSNVLGKEYQQYVTWSFKADAATVDGVAVDRWTIEPSAKVLAELEKEIAGDKDLTELKNRLGGFKLQIDRAETGGRVTYVIAPGSSEAYLASALAAQKGTKSLSGDAGLEIIEKRQPTVTHLVALDVKKTMGWVREIMPADQASEIPPGLGNNFSDFFVTGATNDAGLSTGEFVVSQTLINQIRDLAQKM
jgi:hypothetical protein